MSRTSCSISLPDNIQSIQRPINNEQETELIQFPNDNIPNENKKLKNKKQKRTFSRKSTSLFLILFMSLLL